MDNKNLQVSGVSSWPESKIRFFFYIFFNDKLKETENSSRKVFRSPLMSLLGLYKVENFWFCEVIDVTAMQILEELIQQRQNVEKKKKGKKSPSSKEAWLCVCNLSMLFPRQRSRRMENLCSLGDS